MINNRVVITGIGVVAPNALGAADFEVALKEGRSGIRFFEISQSLNFRCQIAGKPLITEDYKARFFDDYYQNKLDNNAIIYACLAGFEAWENAGLTHHQDQIDFDSGMIIGSGALGLDGSNHAVFSKILAGNNKQLGSRAIPESMSSGAAAYLNKILGLGNRILSNSSACITGTESVLLGYEHLKLGKAKRMLCGSTEGDGIFIWGAFDAMRILTSDSNEDPTNGSRPMCNSSVGFVPGSGSGAMVLETLESAKSRGAKIYAEILGADVNSGGLRDGGSMTAPNSNAVVHCMKNSLREAKVNSDEIDLISGHLTGTKGDATEIKNWKKALGGAQDKFPLINTPKSMIGHCIAGAGSIELVATLIQMEKSFVHGNYNIKEVNPDITAEIPLERIPMKTVYKEINTAIKANFGFGDLNCSIVLRKWKDG